ncbi:unnamed protein product [Lathyrus sativus]|nr:unnamed protein product [Lathyrus sativus]
MSGALAWQVNKIIKIRFVGFLGEIARGFCPGSLPCVVCALLLSLLLFTLCYLALDKSTISGTVPHRGISPTSLVNYHKSGRFWITRPLGHSNNE